MQQSETHGKTLACVVMRCRAEVSSSAAVVCHCWRDDGRPYDSILDGSRSASGMSPSPPDDDDGYEEEEEEEKGGRSVLPLLLLPPGAGAAVVPHIHTRR